MLRIYNTLTRQKEDFVPIHEGKAYMYSCGPTVYNYAHIGNLRTYIFMDLFRRTLKYDGYKLKGVMNITDVGHLLSDGDTGEDKMQKASREQKKTPWEIAAYYTDVFFTDLKKLNIGKPEIIAKATDHIQEMIDYVQKLVDKGYGYEIDDGIYFDIGKFPGYGKLSRLSLEDQQAGARVEVNSQKRHPADFALWKKAEPEHIMQWPSPWGMGYPGWHIECSAMPFDIHTGGVDHIPVHHENEIAQNEALTGKQSVNYWVHGEFMLVNNGKMSKSLGNTYRISDLEERGYNALDFRYFCLNTHYRKKLNFTFEGLDAAKAAYSRLLALVYKHKTAPESGDTALADKYVEQFKQAIDDDLNVPLALGILWTMMKEKPAKELFTAALEFDKVLGLDLDKAQAPKEEEQNIDVPQDVLALCEERKAAKASRDWAKSDAFRAKLAENVYKVIDINEGYSVEKA